MTRFGSKSADQQGSDNLIGLKSPAVDAILHTLARRADTRATSRRHPCARPGPDAWLLCDPALVHGVAPGGVSNTLAYPATLPLYYTAEDWITSTWWFKPPASRVQPASAAAAAK